MGLVPVGGYPSLGVVLDGGNLEGVGLEYGRDEYGVVVGNDGRGAVGFVNGMRGVS